MNQEISNLGNLHEGAQENSQSDEDEDTEASWLNDEQTVEAAQAEWKGTEERAEKQSHLKDRSHFLGSARNLPLVEMQRQQQQRHQRSLVAASKAKSLPDTNSKRFSFKVKPLPPTPPPASSSGARQERKDQTTTI